MREKKGRKGKTVTTISGFNEANDDLKQIIPADLFAIAHKKIQTTTFL